MFTPCHLPAPRFSRWMYFTAGRLTSRDHFTDFTPLNLSLKNLTVPSKSRGLSYRRSPTFLDHGTISKPNSTLESPDAAAKERTSARSMGPFSPDRAPGARKGNLGARMEPVVGNWRQVATSFRVALMRRTLPLTRFSRHALPHAARNRHRRDINPLAAALGVGALAMLAAVDAAWALPSLTIEETKDLDVVLVVEAKAA